MKSASNPGPTGYFSSCGLDDFGTFPRKVTFLLAFSFAIRILCFGAITAKIQNQSHRTKVQIITNNLEN